MNKIFKKIMQYIFQIFFRKKVAIRDSWIVTPKKQRNMLEFLCWFDRTKSVVESISSGQVDWEHRFKRFKHFNSVTKGIALEIGFGGGRLLAHAAKDFDKVIGVDIHQNFAMSKKFLALNNITNYQLIKRSEMSGISPNSIDYVYSFIVFQHFDSFKEVKFYLDHIHRILTNDGVAHIYFGKNNSDGVEVTKDGKFYLRDCSLFINIKTMKSLIEENFKIISIKDKVVKDPVKNIGESVQSMIIFKRLD